jgi:isoquinoline 1-oxidoreductase alpha subunit
MRFAITVNGSPEIVDAEPEAALLWVLRDHIGLIDGERAQSCQTAIRDAAGREVTTIEGLAAMRHALLAAWIEEQVPQCGYCQPGMIMSAADLLARNKQPSRAEIVAHMQNICRCGTYPRVIRAIQRAASGDES